ncbi:C-GCAxxG-C-C family protein [Desulfosporosinus sp. Sb-LF]|uniref:C-GCAxxG-C-C family protein n=1 Tax=Desulfosporosinus sp. Sb-LF TaxID=2560027 RepID=UPI001FB135E9|nr:C-GCAxxG-C-C family protein [Desulfosporosinus sp. Sb-LF]
MKIDEFERGYLMKSDVAIECFSSGFNCAQAVFSTYCDALGLETELAKRIACGFGAGMGYIGETCGAVTGAIMLIGLKYGKVDVDDNAAKDITYELVQEFTKRFKAINSSVKCKELLGFDLSIPEDLDTVKEKQLFSILCPKFVRDSSEIIEELLEVSE